MVWYGFRVRKILFAQSVQEGTKHCGRNNVAFETAGQVPFVILLMILLYNPIINYAALLVSKKYNFHCFPKKYILVFWQVEFNSMPTLSERRGFIEKKMSLDTNGMLLKMAVMQRMR